MIDNARNFAKAEYKEQVLPEYAGNPLIEALPPIWSPDKVVKMLAYDPEWNEGEREMDAGYRFHCIWRLFRYFQPLDTHIDIEQRISRAIRQGYIGKNPLSSPYVQLLNAGYEMVQNHTDEFSRYYTGSSTAFGFTVIGISGVGKTTAMQRILSLYPQVIQHSNYAGKPLCITQLSWLKIDCPFDGSLKGLCMNFFDEVDRVLGTDYMKKFLRGNHTIDALLPRMAQIATSHCLGMLVIDEIQHLSLAKGGGSDKMLNFFVTLVNTIGVPVVLIGTTKAMSILQGDFRQARRGSGQGDLLWDRMENNKFWNILIDSMWKNQWTRKRIELTDELRQVIYEESQGIIDIAIKLYAMVQIKAIATGKESFSAKDFREAAAEKLRLVKPMLDALRSGDKKKIFQYEDIAPISIDDYIAAYATRIPCDFENITKPEKLSLEEQAVLKLLEMDISPQIARRSVRKVMKSSPATQNLAIVVRKSFKIALNISDNSGEKQEVTVDGDLRNIKGENRYDAFKGNDIIAGKEDVF